MRERMKKTGIEKDRQFKEGSVVRKGEKNQTVIQKREEKRNG